MQCMYNIYIYTYMYIYIYIYTHMQMCFSQRARTQARSAASTRRTSPCCDGAAADARDLIQVFDYCFNHIE